MMRWLIRYLENADQSNSLACDVNDLFRLKVVQERSDEIIAC